MASSLNPKTFISCPESSKERRRKNATVSQYGISLRGLDCHYDRCAHADDPSVCVHQRGQRCDHLPLHTGKLRSLIIAIFTTIICVLLGYPIAYAIATGPEKSKMFWILMITLPTWINMLVRTYAWVGILQDDGLLNSFLGLFGIGPFKMMYTTFAVVLGMVYNFIPFMILQIHTSLAKMDKSLLEAASDLGANRVQSFLRVTLRYPASSFPNCWAADSMSSSVTSSKPSSSPAVTGTSAVPSL